MPKISEILYAYARYQPARKGLLLLRESSQSYVNAAPCITLSVLAKPMESTCKELKTVLPSNLPLDSALSSKQGISSILAAYI